MHHTVTRTQHGIAILKLHARKPMTLFAQTSYHPRPEYTHAEAAMVADWLNGKDQPMPRTGLGKMVIEEHDAFAQRLRAQRIREAFRADYTGPFLPVTDFGKDR